MSQAASHRTWGLFVGVMVGLLMAVGCTPSQVSDIRRQRLERQALTVRVAPVQNFSGRDLESIPAIVWESGTIARLVTRIQQFTAPLDVLPFAEGKIPYDRLPKGVPWERQLSYAPDTKRLIWTEMLLSSDVTALRDLSENAGWQAAITALAQAAAQTRIDALAALRSMATRHLTALGFVATDADHDQEDTSLRLHLAVETFDWSNVLESGQITGALVAVLVETTSGQVIWRRATGPVFCDAKTALGSGSLDLRALIPAILDDLLTRLLD